MKAQVNSGWICACPRLVVWAVSERNRSETERSLRPLNKNPLRAPTIFRTLRSALAPRYAPLTCSGVCTSHWCLVMSFWLKVCIYSHTRGVKLGLGLGFMQTSQVLPHWLNQSFSFWTLSYTQRHCHVRIEKSPNCCYNIRSTQFPRISLYALTLRFVLIEITKVVKPVH